jgi:hypothetical protein
MANVTQPPKHDPRQDSDKPDDAQQQHIREERAAEARKIFDSRGDDLPVTTQTDQLRRSMEMEQVGPAAWMDEQERRIRERQGDPSAEPRQVHGVAPTQKPH